MKAATVEIDRDAMRKERMLPDDYRGPTRERESRAAGFIIVGDDKMGGKRNTFLDSALDRLYSRLVKASKTSDQTDRLRIEYAALNKYHRLFVESGMVGSVGSVDFNRAYSPTPFGRTFLAGSERQCDDRDAYRGAQICLGHKAGIVVDNFVCFGNSLEISGYCVGMGSKTQAIRRAEEVIRESGYKLAVMWGMNKSGGR